MAAKNTAEPDVAENNEDSADEMVLFFNMKSDLSLVEITSWKGSTNKFVAGLSFFTVFVLVDPNSCLIFNVYL